MSLKSTFKKLFGQEDKAAEAAKEVKAKAGKAAEEVKTKAAEESKEEKTAEAAKDASVEAVAELLSISYEEAEDSMKAAKKQYGISFKEFVKYEFYLMETEEDKQRVLNGIADKKRLQKEQRDEMVRTVAQAAGWDFKQAQAAMKEAKQALGVTFKDYAKLELFRYDQEEQKAKYAELLAEKEKKKQQKEEKAKNGPDLPFGGKISSVTNLGIEYYWKKVEIATGYEVFRAYEPNGEYELIFRAEKRNIGTYIDGDFDHSKKRVYYKVRSFLKKADGTIAYSDFTEATEAVYQEKLTLSREATYLYSGITRTIYALHGWGEPADGIWTSDNEAVATVDQQGMITGVSKGECVIRFSSKAIGQQAVSKVVVDRDADKPLAPITSRYQYDSKSRIWKNPQGKQGDEAVIMMVGDLMCSSVQMRNQYSEAKGYNFNDSFDYVKDVMKDSDFAVANLETLLASGWPYMIDEAYIDNYNNCNAPSRYLDAVKYGGFDAVMLANNHNCDGGTRALKETIAQVDRYKFARTGAFIGKEKDPYFIVEINGMKIGFLAYITQATGFNYKEETWTQEERDRHLCIFNPERAKKEILAVREAGAEYVIVYMHWGMKNFFNLTQGQIRDAKAVAEAGADFILGANPHVLQCFDTIVTEAGKEVPCYYSTGNYQAVMNQVEGNRESIVVRLTLKRDASGSVVIDKNQYIPTYAYRHCGRSNWAPVAVTNVYNKGAVKLRRGKILDRIHATIGDKVESL